MTDRFINCPTHGDMLEPGCKRCEACFQHHYKMDGATVLREIINKPGTALCLTRLGILAFDATENEKARRDLALESIIDLVQSVDNSTDEEYALAFMAIRSTLEIYGLGGDA